jgi:hypothetical protein
VALLERKRLSGLERTLRRFRSFLLKALQNYLANAWDRASASKRGGACEIVLLEEVDSESRFLADGSTEASELVFDRNWAFEIIGEGGFGRVWMAEQREPVRRKIALKIIKLGMDMRQVVRFLDSSSFTEVRWSKRLTTSSRFGDRQRFVRSRQPGQCLAQQRPRRGLRGMKVPAG